MHPPLPDMFDLFKKNKKQIKEKKEANVKDSYSKINGLQVNKHD